MLDFSTSVETCNNGAIAANVISVEETNYTSQLNVTVTSGIDGRTIECRYIDERFIRIILYVSLVTVTTGMSFCRQS